LFIAIASQPVQAQPIVPEADGIGTLVNVSGNQFDITGGTQSGANLFHSFQQFGLNSDQIANFISNSTIQNILSRVVGGNPSVIDGLIQVTNGNSNLFLMNPAGIVFGRGASLNVPASFTATTATGISFGDNWFSAQGTNDYTSLVGSPTGFAFTVSEPGSESGLIVNLGNLNVEQGNLTLLGGTILNTGDLSTPNGQITITAVPNENLVRITQEGQVLSLEIEPLGAGTQPNDWTLPILSLPELLTGNETDDTQGIVVSGNDTVILYSSSTEALTVNTDGTVEVTSSNLESDAQTGTIIGSSTEFVGENLNLQAQGDLVLGNSQLVSSNNIELLAQDTVQVESTQSEIFVAQAEGDLLIQGNNGIDIETSEQWFQSGGNLSLISDGVITANSNFTTGGNFSALNLSSVPANFEFTAAGSMGIISSQGDVSFGDYEGVALKVEAQGSLTGGNITITGANTALFGDDPTTPTVATDPDIPILASSPALILRAGVTELDNLPNTPQLDVPNLGTDFTSTGEPSSPGSITVGNINTSGDGTYGGIVSISAVGDVEFQDIETNGGNVEITGASITGGKIDAYALNNNSVTLTSTEGNIVVETITAGRTIDITASGLFQATGVFESSFLGQPQLVTPTQLQDNPDLLQFLLDKTGLPDEASLLEELDNNSFFIYRPTPLPVSLEVRTGGSITIRHNGASGSDTDPISIQGGDAPFLVGPNVFLGDGEPFVPASDPLFDTDDFIPDVPFALDRNETYEPLSLPDNISGTAGAIITITGNASVVLSFQDQVFGVLPDSGSPGDGDGTGGGGTGGGGNIPGNGGVGGDMAGNIPGDGGSNLTDGNTGGNTDTTDNSLSNARKVATQLFEQQDEQSQYRDSQTDDLVSHCQKPGEQAGQPTDETDESDRSSEEEDCEKQEVLQEDSEPRLLRIELQLPPETNTSPDTSTLPRPSPPELLTDVMWATPRQ
jgi:filamentous hemagglutinin family protein